MLNQLTYKPPLPKDYAGSILTALSIYTQDKTLAERLVRQQGLKIVTVYLGLNNINNRKGSAVVLLNCLRHLPGNEEVGDFITSLLFVSRLLFMYALANTGWKTIRCGSSAQSWRSTAALLSSTNEISSSRLWKQESSRS